MLTKKILGHFAKGLGKRKKSNEEALWLRQERLTYVLNNCPQSLRAQRTVYIEMGGR